MKKTKERRNITLALVIYSRLNLNSRFDSPLDIYKIIDGVSGKNRELGLDLWAVRELITYLRVCEDMQTLAALNAIYLQPFSKSTSRRVSRNEITDRILRFSCENYLSERTVYRKLKKARELWLKIRYEADK